MSAEHHRAILDAATQVFSRFGFAKASVDDIARRAGVGKGTVYLHFESKEALFATVVRGVWGKVTEGQLAAMRGLRTTDGKLRAFLRARLDQVTAIARTLQITEETARELLPLAMPYLTESRERELQIIEEIMLEGIRAGLMEVREPRQVAIGLMNWLDGSNFTFSPDSIAELRASEDALVDVFIRGLMAPAHTTR
jgi:AcrR family transcriptional regulator